MKVPEKYYDEIFDFKGRWDVPSKCGLKILTHAQVIYIIVTELYQDNPGSSVPYAGYSLLKQICESKGFAEKDVVYLECNPDTNSKLSFYDEEVFQVSFHEINGGKGRPDYRPLSSGEIKALFS